MRIPTSKILFVEDHHGNATLLSRLLKDAGFEVTIADSYALALRIFQENPFDLVLCDLGLPDGDGCDLLQSMRKIRPVKAIAITGFDGDDKRQRSMNAGFVGHVTKPIEMDKLLKTLEILLAPEI